MRSLPTFRSRFLGLVKILSFIPILNLPNTRFTTPSQDWRCHRASRSAERWEPYDPTVPPVIFGHYWLPKGYPLEHILPNVICVDYSAGKGGPLVACSFHPEGAREGEFTSAE
jgi:hypothetical protein